MIAPALIASELQRVRREASWSALTGAAVLVGILAIALLSPLSGYTPGADVDTNAIHLGPSAAHWLGTDHLGRDLFWRLLLATRAFVGPGLLASLVATALGTALGAASGWTTGAIAAIPRIATGALTALPRFVWVLLVCAVWGDAPAQLGVAVGIAAAPPLAEAIHARLQTLRSTEYLLAARAHGVGRIRLLVVHGLIAGCGRSIARHALLAFGAFLVIETTLAYIGGFGVSEPWPSLGNMLAFEWGLGLGAFAPALAIWLSVAATVAAADAFREDAHG